MKRLFDFCASFIGLVILSPILFFVGVAVKITSKGPVFYRQIRVGKNNKDFKIFKFRSMYVDADKKGLLTVGGKDNRITPVGYYIRKYKIDELAQLINVLLGDMSLVGPRPEVRKYVNMYNAEQMHVLDVRPGITDPASIKYKNENDILAKQKNPEQYYINVIMPEKLKINLSYLAKRNFFSDIKMIFKTIF